VCLDGRCVCKPGKPAVNAFHFMHFTASWVGWSRLGCCGTLACTSASLSGPAPLCTLPSSLPHPLACPHTECFAGKCACKQGVDITCISVNANW